MEDRVPTKPGRVLITPENGSPAYYAMVAMADEPTQVGTALNKQNLLKDSTASAFGLSSKAVPDEVLAKARKLITTAQTTANSKGKIKLVSYAGTGTGGESNPCSLDAGFPFDVAIFVAAINSSSYVSGYSPDGIDTVVMDTLDYSYKQYRGFCPSSPQTAYAKKVSESSFEWYSTAGAGGQLNGRGRTYYFLCFSNG